MKPIDRWLLAVVAVALLPTQRVAATPTEAAVQAEFQQVCQSIRDSYDPFYGKRRLEEGLRLLEADAGTAVEKALLRGALGRERLKLGQTEEAVELLNEALALGIEAQVDDSLLLDLRVHLGLAHLQAAEDENCLLRHSAASCILPFEKEAIHQLRQHTRLAGDTFLEIARAYPRAFQTLLLLNIARMVSGDYPDGVPEELRLPVGAFEPEVAFPRWLDRAPELGIGVVDLAGGAIMDDFDGDGLLDLVSSTWDPCGSLKAFRNRGTGGFEDVTAQWGLDGQFGGLNLIHADYDNDGHLDLYVLRGAWMGELGRIRNSLLRNQLNGAAGGFVDVTSAAGLGGPAYPTQTAAWADYDGDGDLDLYVGNEDPDGKSYPSQLFRNNGNGTFAEVAEKAGVTNDRFAKAVTWGDMDNDGDADLYVSNIGPNRMYRNNGDGTFADAAPSYGLTQPEGRSFASWFWDFDNDGDLDLLVADYESPVPAVAAHYFGLETVDNRPRLYRNDGGSFSEISRQAGLAQPMLPMGSNYGDLDNDGWLDFYYATGEPGYETVMPNIMFRNVSGRRFQEITFAGGFGHLQKGHGVAFGDLDNDGDQDLFHQLGGFFPGDSYSNALFENPTTGSTWITLRLEGVKANRFGVGARIGVRIVEDGSPRSVHVLAGSGGTFGGSSMQQEIGLGSAERIEEIVVRWPGSGTEQRFTDVSPNRIYRLEEGRELEPLKVPRIVFGGSKVLHPPPI